MPVSQYFSHIGATNEQDLYHDLAIEMVQLSGIDVHYIKVEQVQDSNYDKLFGENRFEVLGQSVVIEMYLKDMEQPYVHEEMYAKFGLTQPSSCAFLVAVRRFDAEFNHRPREGDYIYIPPWNNIGPDDIFRIASVDVRDYQVMALGSPVYYFIKCERAKYNHQIVNTGSELFDTETAGLLNNNSVTNDPNADNDPLQVLSDQFIQFDESNPFGTP